MCTSARAVATSRSTRSALIARKAARASTPTSISPTSREPLNKYAHEPTGNFRARRGSKGFTLIEILVVMFIVSIMTGIAVANMPTFVQTGEFDTEARRLMTLIRMVREEAVLQAEEYGLRVSPHGYEFMVYDNRQQSWSVVAQRPFQARGVA
ncbi:MAG: type II secretion system minor pseudopilin GspH [Gammaproteobacteria bacterium]|nr:type II secretion system minor pseudopilin GspH [Gammaproteobacteria bacterium]